MEDTIRQALEICQAKPSDLKPGHIAELVFRLDGLASWWLQPSLLNWVRKELGFSLLNPRLPAIHGSCWIVFAQQHPRRWPALRDAFLLPLQWRPNTSHSRRLPPKLAELAESVATQLDLRHWGINLTPVLDSDYLDLSAIDEFLEVQSGWVSLAAGLLVAAEGGKPDPDVWATGGWGEGGIGRVDLGKKLGLAAEFGARQFFVPESQLEEAKQVLLSQNCDNIQVGPLFEGTIDVREALRDYLRELDVPPARSEPRQDRAAYYLRQQDEERAKRFYRENLLPEIVQELRSQWQRQGGPAATHLVTIASDNPELVWIALEVIQPRQCLVLYTGEKQEKLKQLSAMRAHTCMECKVVPRGFDSVDDLLAGARAVVRQFAAGADPEALVLDLTPGTKEMSMVLAFEVAQPDYRLIYLRHRWQGPKVVPFSEELRAWPARWGRPQFGQKNPEG